MLPGGKQVRSILSLLLSDDACSTSESVRFVYAYCPGKKALAHNWDRIIELAFMNRDVLEFREIESHEMSTINEYPQSSIITTRKMIYFRTYV